MRAGQALLGLWLLMGWVILVASFGILVTMFVEAYFVIRAGDSTGRIVRWMNYWGEFWPEVILTALAVPGIVLLSKLVLDRVSELLGVTAEAPQREIRAPAGEGAVRKSPRSE